MLSASLSLQLIDTLGEKLGVPPGSAGFAFTAPQMLSVVRTYGLAEARGEFRLAPQDLTFKCADVGGIRLYLAYFPRAKTKGVAAAWQEPGLGLSTRLAESLLEHVASAAEVGCDWASPPAPTYVAETPSHARLRERLCEYVHRAAVDPAKVAATPADVFLYPTGMAAIYYIDSHIASCRDGTVLALGSLFNNTIQLLRETHGSQLRHFPHVDDAGLAALDTWLRGEKDAGRAVRYAIIEFPSNPVLVSADLARVRDLARAHDFILVVDDTIASFSNADLLPTCDLLVSSLTKSFSGYANVMGGSTILNPLSPHYPALSAAYAAGFHNEFFGPDVDVLLSNSEDYLARSAKLGANAALLARHLRDAAARPSSPVAKVHHPSVLPCEANYTAHLRRPTDAYTPSYPCLLSVDFVSLEAAKAFYDTLGFYPGPHLGAHKSLSLCYGALAFSKDEQEKAFQADFGVLEEAVRISVGLEEWDDLRDTVDVALKAATDVVNGVGS